MIKTKILSARAERKMQRAILDLSRGGPQEKVKAARMRMELQRARQYRDGHAPPRKDDPRRRPRGSTVDVLQSLHKQGGLTDERFTAAEKIGVIWEALCAGRDLQAADYEPRIRADGPYRGPIEKMPADLDRLYRAVWKPWAGEVSKLYILNERGGKVSAGISYLTVAIEIAAYHIPISNLVLSLGCNRAHGAETLKTVFFQCCDAWVSAEKCA